MDEQEIYNQFGLPLKRFIKAHYKNQKTFCISQRISSPMLSAIIHGKRRPPIDLLKDLQKKGFRTPFFDIFFSIKDAPGSLVSVEDYQFLINAMRNTIVSKELLIERCENFIKSLQKDIQYQIEAKREVKRESAKLVELCKTRFTTEDIYKSVNLQKLL